MLEALLRESTNSICYKITVKILPVSHVTRKQYCLNAFSVLSTEEGFFWGVHPRSPRSSAVTKQLQHNVTVSPGPSAHTEGSPKLRDPLRAYLSLGQFCPRAFRMASVMLQQPEAHRDCSLWHPLHIVMSPSSVICYERDKDSITGRDTGGGRATCCVFSFQISNQELNRGQILLLSTHKCILGPPHESQEPTSQPRPCQTHSTATPAAQLGPQTPRVPLIPCALLTGPGLQRRAQPHSPQGPCPPPWERAGTAHPHCIRPTAGYYTQRTRFGFIWGINTHFWHCRATGPEQGNRPSWFSVGRAGRKLAGRPRRHSSPVERISPASPAREFRSPAGRARRQS